MSWYSYEDWNLVLVNILLFALFALTIPFKKKPGRRSGSVYVAFVVALYTEMYGFPLTLYALAWLFGYQSPDYHLIREIVGPWLYPAIHPVTDSMVLLGAVLIGFGWWRIYNAKGKLATNDIYAMVRHPQYLGFIILTLGMAIHWITILVVVMWPILVILYYRLARDEEQEMKEQFGLRFVQYAQAVPMFAPIITPAAWQFLIVMVLALALLEGIAGMSVACLVLAVGGIVALVRRVKRVSGADSQR